VYIVSTHDEDSHFEMLTLWTHLVSQESATSEELQQVQITLLGPAAAEAREEEVKTKRPWPMFAASPGLNRARWRGVNHV
jgi:hypothetical protein